MTEAAAITTGSTVNSGPEPCPPRPNSFTSQLSDIDSTGPLRMAIRPAGRDITCCAKAMSGFGKRLTIPSSTMALAPSPVSSAGWNTAMTVPRHLSRFCARIRVAPISQVTCMSCPQECAIAVSTPDDGSLPVFVLA